MDFEAQKNNRKNLKGLQNSFEKVKRKNLKKSDLKLFLFL